MRNWLIETCKAKHNSERLESQMMLSIHVNQASILNCSSFPANAKQEVEKQCWEIPYQNWSWPISPVPICNFTSFAEVQLLRESRQPKGSGNRENEAAKAANKWNQTELTCSGCSNTPPSSAVQSFAWEQRLKVHFPWPFFWSSSFNTRDRVLLNRWVCAATTGIAATRTAGANSVWSVCFGSWELEIVQPTRITNS
jgi:hypothetical protein